MLDTDTILISAITFFTGTILGYVARRRFSKSIEISRDTSDELTRIQKEYADYQNLVNQHMIQLSQQTRKVARNYQEIHEQLALSSTRLASQEISNQILQHHSSNFFLDNLREASSSPTVTVEPPKDYAPKVPGGILSEEYGLQESERNLRINEPNDGSKEENGIHTPSKTALNYESAT
ncbi:MAG: hypothetical protein CBC09_02825 [Cellvibrionales bacterium TMED49]|nr:hypothetical protein [Porticoccaceae bacterium]OUU39326.1 MAG: hypothetical protein CBC09_02825 [Cellvibrionales bacterium TMED49]|tara:strand:+ start:1426 stop:1962 length:537 start_codon:yes stop_codon:yes gene_type:complete